MDKELNGLTEEQALAWIVAYWETSPRCHECSYMESGTTSRNKHDPDICRIIKRQEPLYCCPGLEDHFNQGN